MRRVAFWPANIIFSCTPAAFSDKGDTRAYKQLLDVVLAYFLQQQATHASGKVVQTSLPPIYLQHPGKVPSSNFWHWALLPFDKLEANFEYFE
jgi:hypothetical protein